MGGKFKIPAIEHRPARFPSINTCFLVIALDLLWHTIEINKGIDKSTEKGLLLLVFHYLNVLPTGVSKNITEKGYLLSFTSRGKRDIVITPVVGTSLTRVRFHQLHRRF